MARCREFDEQEALRRARDLFWARGYAETSLDDLMQATGVCRQSLYNTFGSKAGLFAAAIDDYRRSELEQMHALLQRDLPLRELLDSFLERVIGLMLKCGPHGCFFANTMVEKERVGAAAVAMVAQNSARYEQELCGVLERARARGEAVTAKPAVDAARFLLNTMLGLSTLARIAPDRDAMRRVAQVALDAVAPP
ncbi:MAG: TetR/AcrR family transcriptional regulator [Nevskia sp.]|nr:TetR/AcrR family transcriptional regulator [Nevskia sp.]